MKMVTNYQKGYNFERKIVNEARKKGNQIIAFRSSGSHSKIDCVIINPKIKEIRLIQAKNKKIYGKEKKELEKLKQLSGRYNVKFEVITK